MYYLLITIAHPDYKRPFTTNILKFFESEDEAINAREEEYLKFLDSNEYDKEEYENNEIELHYVDGYMDMLPFSGEIGEVKVDK